MINKLWNVCGILVLCSCAGVFKKAELPWKANGELALPASFEILEPSTQVRVGTGGRVRLVGDCDSPDRESATISGDIVEGRVAVPCEAGRFEIEVQLTPGDGFKAVLFSYTFLLSEKRNQVIDLWLDTQGPDGPNLDLAALAVGRVGELEQSAFPIFGNCTNPRELLLVAVNGQDWHKTTCRSDYRFYTELDLSSLKDGSVELKITPFDAYGNPGTPSERKLSLDRSLCSGKAQHSHFQSGSGTDADPYVVCTATQLEKIFASDANLKASYVLGDTLSFTEKWREGPLNASGKAFSGRVDGRNFAIKGYKSTGSLDVSIFGTLEGAEIRRLAIVDAEVESKGSAPLIAMNISESKLEELFVHGLIRAGDSGGGMTLVSANNEWTSISSQIDLSSSASEIANWFLETQGDVIRSSGIQGSVFGARDVVAGLALNASKGSQLIESYIAPQVLADEAAMHWSLVYRGSDELIVKDSFVDIERHPTNDGFSKSIGIGTAAFRDPAELGWSQGWLWRERDFHPVPAWLDWK